MAADYYAAMEQVERRLNLLPDSAEFPTDASSPAGRTRLLLCLDQLARPELDPERRIELVAEMRMLLQTETAELSC